MNAKLRGWWWARQGLDGSLTGASAREALRRSGWMRSVGGAGPYVGLFARAGLSRASVDAAVATVDIAELPSARGCTYVLPADDFAVGLRMGQGFGDEAQIAMARKHLGVTDAELVALEDAVVAALGKGVMDPRALKDVLGDAVRNLGAEGKKRGTTTTLPLALGRLQSHGRIRRVPLDGRLDRQRYAYTCWGQEVAGDEAFLAVARAWWRQAGPATPAQFQWFSGLGARQVKELVARLDLVPVDDLWILAEDAAAFAAFEPPGTEQVRFLSNLDPLFLHRRELQPLLSDADAARGFWTEKGTQAGSALADLSSQAIVDRGRIIGLWDFDPGADRLTWATFEPATAAVRAEAERVEAWIRRDLGDVRSFSLDSPESRAPRLAAIRAM